MCIIAVAPLVGAWIEMVVADSRAGKIRVAPLVGAWIEIGFLFEKDDIKKSLPLWERGLKYKV